MDFSEWVQMVKILMFYVSAYWDLIIRNMYKVACPTPLWNGSYASLNNIDFTLHLTRVNLSSAACCHQQKSVLNDMALFPDLNCQSLGDRLRTLDADPGLQDPVLWRQ